MVFIKYLKHSKGFVMYREHLNGGMTKIKSYNVDFLEDKFTSIAEIKKELDLYELEEDIQPSLGEGEELNSDKVIEDGATSLSNMDGGGLSPQENDVRPQSSILRKINLRMRFLLNLQVRNVWLVHIFKIPYLKRIVRVMLTVMLNKLNNGGVLHLD